MAYEIGIAANHEDLFEKCVDFVTSNATLVSQGQNWSILSITRDNIQSVTSSLPDPSLSHYRKIIHTSRLDPRSINIESAADNSYSDYYSSSFVPGASYVTWALKAAKTISKIRMVAPKYSGNSQYMIKAFRLFSSTDNVNWSLSLTVSSQSSLSTGEVRTFNITPTLAKYWKIIVDTVGNGSTTTISWNSITLHEGDGSVANNFGSEVILLAPGTSGSDAIYTGIRTEYDVINGWYNLFLNGYSGYSSELSWFNQPGALPGYGSVYVYGNPMIPCWNAQMPYWLVASGRSLKIVAKVSTSYESGYLGFMLPYATPQQFPYPLIVAGSLNPQLIYRGEEWRYSYANWRHGSIIAPGSASGVYMESVHTSMYLRDNSGNWLNFGNRGSNGTNYPEQVYSATIRGVWPHSLNNDWINSRKPYRECLGGGYILQPCILFQTTPQSTIFGELDGCYSISGYDNAPENTGVVNGKNIVVFQNAYRNTVHEFWALELN